MKLNGRVDTILGSTYWKDGRLLSIHTNAMTRELEQKLSEQTKQALKDIDELADLIIFHAKVRENAKIMSEPWEM